MVPKANKEPDGENWHVLIALGSLKDVSFRILRFLSWIPDSSAPLEKVKFSF